MISTKVSPKIIKPFPKAKPRNTGGRNPDRHSEKKKTEQVVGFEVLTAVVMKSSTFWDITL
jgi:hypothetical protein